MQTARVYDAAGATTDFLYDTGEPDLVSAVLHRLVMQAEILAGRLKGQQVTIDLKGTFDLEAGLAEVREFTESVAGRVHFKFTLDHPIDIADTFGGIGDDALRFIGNRYSNVFHADRGADVLSGRDGDDRLYGAGGNDRIYGGTGADRLSGGNGGDSLEGGTGRDLLTGGAGADHFVFATAAAAGLGRSARDTITDFLSGRDQIDLHRIDADIERAGNQFFDFIESHGFSGQAGELRYARGVISADIDGDGKADFEIALSHLPGLLAGDLIL